MIILEHYTIYNTSVNIQNSNNWIGRKLFNEDKSHHIRSWHVKCVIIEKLHKKKIIKKLLVNKLKRHLSEGIPPYLQ